MKLDARLEALRHEFDRSFAVAPSEQTATDVSLLAVRIGGEPYAVRLDELVTLLHDRRPTPLPGAPPELLGVVGTPAGPLACWDLAALLGRTRVGAPSWLMVVDRGALGLAVETFEGQLRCPNASIVVQVDGNRADGGHVEAIAELDGGARPLLRLASVVATVRQRARRDAARKGA